MKLNKHLLIYCLLISLVLFSGCESQERYYRPDLPEQLCAIGIIDIDDTTIYDIGSMDIRDNSIHPISYAREVSFEKSFQSEYYEEVKDSLREFTLAISDENEDMFVYQHISKSENFQLELPDNLQFVSGQKYYMHASEGGMPYISGECIVPEIPPELSLISIKTMFTMLDPTIVRKKYPDESDFTRRTAEIEFAFPNINPESYYAILLTGSMSDRSVDWSPGWGSVLLNYNLVESNTSGFFSSINGRNTRKEYWRCNQVGCGNEYRKDSLFVYFIDGSKIPDGNCKLKISAQWDWIQFPPYFIKCFRIRLMSIPKEAYLFYKNLYTYSKVVNDPFAEPVNINGNIVGGNGVFAICRSRELIVYTGQKGGMYDPFF